MAEQQEIQIASNSFYSLQSEQSMFFHLNGSADLYYSERYKDADGRMLFLLRLEGPLVIASFPIDEKFDLIISPQSPLSIKILDAAIVSQSNGLADTSTLIENGITSLISYFSSTMVPQSAIALDAKSTQAENNKIYTGQPDSNLLWISGFAPGTKLLNEVTLDHSSLPALPLNEKLWYNAAGDSTIKVYTTPSLIEEAKGVDQLRGFNQLMSFYFTNAFSASASKKLRQVWGSFNFRKKSVEDAFARLAQAAIKSNADDNLQTIKTLSVDTKRATDEKLLLDTCKVVGDHESIVFKPPFKTVNDKDEPLKHILRASNIRSRRVFLHDQWWTNNHGGLLAYLKDSDRPVALIPKGNNYWLTDLAVSGKMKVDSTIAQALKPTAVSFFTPFPSGSLSAKDLLKFAYKFTKKDVLLFLVVGIVGALLALFVPIMSGYIFDTIIPGGKTKELMSIGFILLSTVITVGVLNYVKSMATLRFEGISSYKLQSALWDRILSLRVPFFSLYNPGDLAERSLGIEKIRNTLSANVMSAVSSGIFSIFYLALLFYYDVRLALLALVLGTAVAVFTVSISLLAYKHVAFQRRMEAIISGFMMMVIRGVSKVRLTGSKEKVFNLWSDKFAQQKEHYSNKMKLLITADIFTFTFPILASLLIYLRIYNLLTDPASSFEIGDFVAFNSAYLYFQGALIATFMVTVPLMGIKPTYELFKPILDAETEDYDNKTDPGTLKGNIEVAHLSFKYNDSADWVLRDINIKINPGEFVALAGSSGSGKSTLYRILLGFEHYQEGSVLFDNHELKDLDIRNVRDQLGVVLQNGKIMQGTVLYNIIGTSNYTEEQAWEAARNAGCDKDIDILPLKMHTVLPPGGGTLSGGQQQRIIIARALVRKPRILLFDEATSALDNETQEIVSKNIEALKTTRIVIAHRLSTIIHADRIVVMDKGKIVEEGTFEELTKMNGFFQNLVKSQLA